MNEKRFALQRIPFFQLANVHRQQPAFILLCTNGLHLACSVCLLYAPEHVLRSFPVLSPESHRCVFLLSYRCVLEVVRIGCSVSMELVITFPLSRCALVSGKCSHGFREMVQSQLGLCRCSKVPGTRPRCSIDRHHFEVHHQWRNEYPLSNFRRLIAKSPPSSPVLYKRTASCLFQKAFDVRLRPCHQKVIDVSSCFLLDAFSTWFETIEQATVVL